MTTAKERKPLKEVSLDVKDHPFHKIANEWPLLSKEELEDMAEDIIDQGQLEKIIKLGKEILEGRNRYLACLMAGVRPIVEQYRGKKDEDSLRAFCTSKNDVRRHENQKDQEVKRKERLKRIAKMRQEGASISTIAEAEGISRTRVAQDIQAASQAGLETAPSDGTVKGTDGSTRNATEILCGKCQRLGKVKGCPMCAEARKEARQGRTETNGEAPKKKAAPKVYDALGREVPAKRLDVFKDMWPEYIANFLEGMSENLGKQRLNDEVRKRARKYPFLDEKEITDGLNTVREFLDKVSAHFRVKMPTLVCSKCDGKGGECGLCRGSGMLPAEMLEKEREKQEKAEKKAAEEK